MDKQKQIEEMADIMSCCVNCRAYDELHPKCQSFIKNEVMATVLYNAGYRKIPENAVVLTEEESVKAWKKGNCNAHAIYGLAYEQARKETAEKFAERLKDMAYQSTDWSHGAHPMVVEVDYIDEIAEEITEGEKEISNETI